MHEAVTYPYLIEDDRGEQLAAAQQAERTNILIVDDLTENRLAYSTILDELGQNLMMASSGEEALKLLLQHEFAVILLDVNMAGMDGFEIASLIRKRRKSASTPIIFLTAFTDEVRMAQGYASGAVDYLPTPVVPGILKAKVRVFIELSQMRRQAAKQAEERARRQAAEEADRRKDEFLGMLSHELRNPLGPILNVSHILRRIAPEDERLEGVWNILDRQVKHMTRLIDDLLDATRLAHGKIALHKESCDLTQLVRQTAEDYRHLFDSRGIALEVEVPDAPLWMKADSTRLVQTVGNLLHNAHKFTDDGGKVSLALSIDKRGHVAEITVVDTGIGIEAEMLPHVFDVFRQAEQGLDHSRGGLGLGLALVRGLVELHGGEVFAGSEGLGRGARFHVRLPIEKVTATANLLEAPEVVPEGERYRILLIEDNRLTAESTELLLNYDGYQVHTAFNGIAGLEAAKTFRPQVILCDIGLPGMDGYQLTREIRNDSELADVYIIALTGYGRDEEIKLAREAGFDVHMTKPIDYEHLKRTLSSLPVKCLSE